VTSDARRAGLLTVLADHVPGDREEAAAVARLRALLAAAPDPFARTTLPAHVTASAVVVDPTGHVLLHLHRRVGRWLQPGGHVEDGEDPQLAAVRETREETGLVAVHVAAGGVLVHVDEHPGPDGHVHLDLRYLLQVGSVVPSGRGEDVRGNGPELRWVDPAAPGDVDRSLARALTALRRRPG
jgi:8-oxo-dGTP pyrophosphatase MutT (NUDIX family)